MENDSAVKALLVAEGSGGHLIPALEVAADLARRGARVKVWYAERKHTATLMSALVEDVKRQGVEADLIPVAAASNPIERLWQCGQLWRRAQCCFDTFAPDVVVGFGGWVSAPVVLAARRRRIGSLLHEQNVVLGKANRLLAPWVDRVAVSFRETQAALERHSTIMTGMPVREAIGASSRMKEAKRFGLNPDRPTVLILGGSQGARAINHLMSQAAGGVSQEERCSWQIVHVTGSADEATVRAAYAAHQIAAWVSPFLVEMEAAYALADMVIARAGASTIAELARCGKPAILIPFPHAGRHQHANAQVVEAIGGGLMIEESNATSEGILASVRRILTDERLRTMMGKQIQALHCDDAAQRLSRVILEVAGAPVTEECSWEFTPLVCEQHR